MQDALDDEFDAIADVSHRRGPEFAVVRCRKMLERSLTAGDRARVLQQLGEYSELAGDQVAAEPAYREAVELDAATVPWARALLASWCLRNDRRDEADLLAREVRRSRTRTYEPYHLLGEAFEEAGDLAEATRWFTAGALTVERDPDGSDFDLYLLLRARRRVREAQGFEADADDLMVDELREFLYPDRS